MTDAALVDDVRAAVSALIAAHPALALRVVSPLEVGFEHAGATVTLVFQPPHARPAFAAGRRVSAMYRVAGRLSAEGAATLRDALTAIGRTLSNDPSPDVLRQLDDAPEEAISAVATRYAQAIEGGRLAEPSDLPPCLDLAQRPAWRSALSQPLLAPLPTPCDRCAAARACPACARSTHVMTRPLSPLRHGDGTAAALAFVEATCEAFDQTPSAAAIAFVLALSRARGGVSSGPPLPMEVSLKRVDDGLAPLLRLVDYAPDHAPGDAPRETRIAGRNEAILALAGGLVDGPGREALARFSAIVGDGTPLSLGAEIGVIDGRARAQVYAHLDPRSPDVAVAAVTAAFGACEGGDEALPATLALLGRTRGHVALLSLSPTTDAPWSLKAYLALPLATEDAPSGLRAASLGRLAPFAPSHGLAVLAGDARGVRFRKWDFPAITHFQRSRPLIDAFVAGMHDGDRAKTTRILDGARFAAWPTWVSVGERESVLYFVPRLRHDGHARRRVVVRGPGALPRRRLRRHPFALRCRHARRGRPRDRAHLDRAA
jgi:hypothetical protein